MAVSNRGPELQLVGYILAVTAFITVLLRVFVRACIVKSFGFDDWCMCSALITFLLFVVSALIGVHYGTGRHREDLDRKQYQKAMMYWWWCYIWYCLTMIASRVSIGYFLLRITVRKLDIWIIYSVMCITVSTGVVFFFVTLFQCSPISFFWNQEQSGHCIDIEIIIALTYLYSVFGVISDFTYAILPMFLVYSLNMGHKTKIAVMPVLAMACLASSAVVVRFAFINDFKNPDFLWATIDIAIWSTTEQGLAVTAGSLATLQPLFRWLGHKLIILTSGTSAMRDTDQPIRLEEAKTTREVGNKGNKNQDAFVLDTFMRDDIDDHLRDQEITCAKRSETDRASIGRTLTGWVSRGNADNESEEELTGTHLHGRDTSRITVHTALETQEDRIRERRPSWQ
ncbi:hypothetical protein FVEN_g769 [Fusarium venenatum]|uniref:Rhodopsin domain-containing protein n=1 Tax=Fusarium venenatum TaxID=56646 RepID=A0A2L2U3T6_9HYPO|nr:uncharacterized protein FVRRES_10827 [Fusarium venenatum]KAG8361730.1 hypothetical protein FVEN_g769 [Fusarium venenatum]KAH6967402.1 hypothetical protein EDB82DRAFT_563206 [Fusarium venenatum]CEI70750.1 unnamed protein product [Fusarium venenatum]